MQRAVYNRRMKSLHLLKKKPIKSCPAWNKWKKGKRFLLADIPQKVLGIVWAWRLTQSLSQKYRHVGMTFLQVFSLARKGDWIPEFSLSMYSIIQPLGYYITLTSQGIRTIQWAHIWIRSGTSLAVQCIRACLQSFPASGSFPGTQFFTSGGQRIGLSASASVLPVNIQDWFPLGWTGWISLQSKAFSRVFSNTTVQKHQFFSAQLSL